MTGRLIVMSHTTHNLFHQFYFSCFHKKKGGGGEDSSKKSSINLFLSCQFSSPIIHIHHSLLILISTFNLITCTYSTGRVASSNVSYLYSITAVLPIHAEHWQTTSSLRHKISDLNLFSLQSPVPRPTYYNDRNNHPTNRIADTNTKNSTRNLLLL